MGAISSDQEVEADLDLRDAVFVSLHIGFIRIDSLEPSFTAPEVGTAELVVEEEFHIRHSF